MADRELKLDLLATDRATPVIKRVGDAVDDLGKEMRDASNDSIALDGEISKVKNTLGELAKAFANTQDAAERIDLSRAMRSQQSKMRELIKVKDMLPSPAEMAEGAAILGRSAASSLSLAIGRGMSSSGVGGTAIIAGVASLAAMIGPLVSAAILGASGSVGIVGGIVAAAGDSRVKSAFGQLTDVASKGFEDIGRRFAPALVPEINKVKAAIDQLLRGDLGAAIMGSVKLMGPLFDGIIGFVKNLVPGIRAAIDSSGPIFGVLQKELPELGTAFANLFRTAAENAPQAAAALEVILNIVEGIIAAFGIAIDASVFLWNGLLTLGIAAADTLILLAEIVTGGFYDSNDDWIGDMRKEMVRLRDGTQGVPPALNEVGVSVATLNDGTVVLNGSLEDTVSLLGDLIGRNVSFLKATTDADLAVANSSKTIEHNNKTIKNNAERHAANMVVLQGMIDKFNTYMTKGAEAGETTESLSGKQKVFESALRDAADKADINGSAVDDMIRKYRNTPELVVTDAQLKNQEAISAIRVLNNKLDGIDKYIPVTVAVNYTKNFPGPSNPGAFGLYTGREKGGPVHRGEAYVVGEKRAEVFVPDRDGTIIPSLEQAQSQSYGGRMAGGSGGSGQALTLVIKSGGSRMDDLLVEIINKAVTARGGNVQTVLGKAS